MTSMITTCDTQEFVFCFIAWAAPVPSRPSESTDDPDLVAAANDGPLLHRRQVAMWNHLWQRIPTNVEEQTSQLIGCYHTAKLKNWLGKASLLRLPSTCS